MYFVFASCGNYQIDVNYFLLLLVAFICTFYSYMYVYFTLRMFIVLNSLVMAINERTHFVLLIAQTVTITLKCSSYKVTNTFIFINTSWNVNAFSVKDIKNCCIFEGIIK